MNTPGTTPWQQDQNITKEAIQFLSEFFYSALRLNGEGGVLSKILPLERVTYIKFGFFEPSVKSHSKKLAQK
mgnify:CR=1 FL=1